MLLDREDVASNLTRVADLFKAEKYEEAMDLLQECINTSRIESKEFMERLKDETKDREILSSLTHMYFLNFI